VSSPVFSLIFCAVCIKGIRSFLFLFVICSFFETDATLPSFSQGLLDLDRIGDPGDYPVECRIFLTFFISVCMTGVSDFLSDAVLPEHSWMQAGLFMPVPCFHRHVSLKRLN